jgi:chaperone BCS1
VIESILSNPVMTGLFGGSVLISALAILRHVLLRVWSFLVWRFTTEMVIFNDDPAFEMVSEWLGSLEYAKKARQLRVTSEYSEETEARSVKVSPGLGLHLIWFQRRPVLIRRSIPPEGGDSSWSRREDIVIRTIGSSSKLFFDLLDQVAKKHAAGTGDSVEVYLFRGGAWTRVSRKAKRALSSVVMPTEQRTRVVRDIETFRQSKQWYADRGIPYRRGMLFCGPPGTGKTSFVMALAGELGMRVYALNLGSITSDIALIDAITSVPENALLLIEDIDVAQRDRKEPTGSKKENGEKLTMSGLLNAIDGVFSRDGRVLIMTTNYPDKLDAALMRPGRADRIEHIGDLEQPEVNEMCRQFLGKRSEAFAKTVKAPIRPAELQRILLEQRQQTEALQ